MQWTKDPFELGNHQAIFLSSEIQGYGNKDQENK